MKWKNIIKVLIASLFTFLILINPMASLNYTKQALKICVDSVIPALFPFFVCSGLLVELNVAGFLGRILSFVMKPVFKLSGGSSLAMIMGLISGYPVGAKTTTDLVRLNMCSPSEGEKLLAFCNNSGPLFILGAVGSGMLGKPEIGVILYAAHFLSSITIAFMMRGVECEIYDRKMSIAMKANGSFGEVLTSCIKKAAEMVFTISGFVVIFNILLSSAEQFGLVGAIASYGIDYNIVKAFIFGFFEPTNGCIAAASALKNHPILLYMLLSSIIGWSGISVHMQVLGIIKSQKLSPKYYFIGKSLMAVISPLYTVLLLKIFSKAINGASIPVSKIYNIPGVYYNAGIYFLMTVTMTVIFILLVLILYTIRQLIAQKK